MGQDFPRGVLVARLVFTTVCHARSGRMRAHSSETHSSITARALRGAGFRNQTTRDFLIPWELLNLTFEREHVEGETLNVKFTP